MQVTRISFGNNTRPPSSRRDEESPFAAGQNPIFVHFGVFPSVLGTVHGWMDGWMNGTGSEENSRVMTHVNLDSDKLSGPRDVNHTSGDARPGASEGESGMQITCFSEVVDDTTLHFQIIILHKQIYAWIGCSSSKLGHVYAAASTRPNNLVSVTSLLGGSSDNIGSGIARRLVLKTRLNTILACNIPKNSPMLEANAEKILIQKLISLGYNRSKAEGCS